MPDNESEEYLERERTVVLNVSESLDGDGINLIEVARSIGESWPKLVGFVISVALIALALSFLITPAYLAETVVMPVKQAGAGPELGGISDSLGGLAALAGIDLDSDQGNKKALAIVQSRFFVTKFIRENDLLPILFDDEWSAEGNEWEDADDAPTWNEAVTYFQEDIMRVVEQSDAGTIAVRIYWKDRDLAADWANRIVIAINEYIREEDIAEAQRSIEFLQRERENTGIVEVRQGISLLIQQQIEGAMLANVQKDYAFKIIDPAVPPDELDYATPNRILWVSIAATLALVGYLIVLILRVAFVGSAPHPEDDQ